jgi:hypothetical protein
MKVDSIKRIATLATVIAVTASVHLAALAFAGPAALYVAPNGSGTDCSSAAPCAIKDAQARVRSLPGGDITVELADGTYRLSSPLEFRAADGGRDGGTVQ